jgi:hypothetical protein
MLLKTPMLVGHETLTQSSQAVNVFSLDLSRLAGSPNGFWLKRPLFVTT